MPLVDRRNDSVVLRIVYDGPPEAGKTTNLRQLCERLSLSRRGTLENPGGGERTQYFDWLDVTGGYVAGHRLRCQLVTVPGQVELARRRRYLLDTADVVVFVADARPSAADGVREALASLQRTLASRSAIPLLVQANKQDVAGALACEELGAALAVGADVPVIGAQACHGIGVLETFMLGVRLAVDRIRLSLVRGEIAQGDAGGWSELLADLRVVDASAALEGLADAATAMVVGEAAAADAGGEPPSPEEQLADDTAPAKDEDLALIATIPRGDVPTGLVWPPASGRFALRALDDERTRGAPIERRGEHEVRCGAWRLFCAAEPLRNRDEARRHLLGTVSRQPAFGALVPASRTIAVGGDGSGEQRLWYAVEATRTLADAISDAVPDLGARVDAAHELVVRLVAIAGRAGVSLVIDAEHLSDDGEQYLAPIWPGDPPTAEEARRALDASVVAWRAFRAAPAEPGLEPMPPALVPPPGPLMPDSDLLEFTESPVMPVGVDEEMVAVEAPIDDAEWELPTVDLPAGMVWPQVRGRAALASLTSPAARVPAPRPWAPRGALELVCGDGWLVHTVEAWCFEELDDGRRALLDAVRWQTRLGALTPEGRTLALSPEGDGARLWMLTPELPSCWERMRAARAHGEAAVRDEVAIALATLDEVRAELARIGAEVELALDVIAVDARPRLLVPPPALAATGTADRLAAQLAAIAELLPAP